MFALQVDFIVLILMYVRYIHPLVEKLVDAVCAYLSEEVEEDLVN